jgi:hypothetical protein
LFDVVMRAPLQTRPDVIISLVSLWGVTMTRLIV